MSTPQEKAERRKNTLTLSEVERNLMELVEKEMIDVREYLRETAAGGDICAAAELTVTALQFLRGTRDDKLVNVNKMIETLRAYIARFE